MIISMINLFNKILCSLGMHYWMYRSTLTGIFLHAYANGTPGVDWYERRCLECDLWEDDTGRVIGYWKDVKETMRGVEF